jgi:methyl-accepting chemotaxis protein
LALEDRDASIYQLYDGFNNVSSAMQHTTGKVIHSVDMKGMAAAQETASSVSEIAQTADTLAQMTEDLQRLMAHFSIGDGQYQ